MVAYAGFTVHVIHAVEVILEMYFGFIFTLNKIGFLLYTYKKYLLILPIFLRKNTKSCITLLAFSDSVSPSSIVYPRRTTFTLVLYLGKIRQRPESESNITMSFFPRFFLFLNVFERKTQRLSALLTSQMTSYICDDVA